ncbi:DUF2809 domain-containing protein [Mucilaginibacter sp.]|uniref:ribosomal maturation YjgA family protein n=1 Tax=Mucilaginibacter sp. TaxID=1882438 RepID=UPI002629E8EA|nr:DUF2809 domain-containing protein [Mucilaginibacter sp.]MDB4924100.1 hypothetical protein [Mucilaginibacter sp.]
MLKARLIYLILIFITVIAGLVSREMPASIVPLFIGDILWGLAVFLLMRFLFIHKSLAYILILSLAYAYATEFSQLYKAPWINNLRSTFLGKALLGETFYWGDLASYTAGIGLGVLVELSLRTLIRSICIRNGLSKS